jgi:hypothetical protein
MQSAQTRADLLAHAGRALYGRRWIFPLGQALKINQSTFRGLATGKGRIPATIWPEILALVVARQRELRTAANFLKVQIAEDKARQLGIVAREIRRVIKDPEDT